MKKMRKLLKNQEQCAEKLLVTKMQKIYFLLTMLSHRSVPRATVV